MSLSPLNPRPRLSLSQKYLHELRETSKKYMKIPREKITRETEKVASYVHLVLTHWDLKVQRHDYEGMKKLQGDSEKKVSTFARCFFTEEPEKASKIQELLNEGIRLLKASLDVENGFQRGGIHEVIKNPDSLKGLVDLFFKRDPWATKQIKEYFTQRGQHLPRLTQYLLNSYDNDPNVFSSPLLRNLIYIDPTPTTIKVALRIIATSTESKSPLLDELIEGASNLEPKAIFCFHQLISRLDLLHNEHHLSIINHIIDKCTDRENPNLSLQNLLMVSATEVPLDSLLTKAVVASLDRFHSLTPTFPLNRSKLLLRLRNFPDTVSKPKVMDPLTQLERPGTWQEIPLIERLCFKVMSVERDRNLIEFMLEDPETRYIAPESTVSSKSFPKAEAILIGYSETKKEIPKRIATEIGSRSQAEIYSLMDASEAAEYNQSYLTPIVERANHNIWMQDVCMMGHSLVDPSFNQFLIPRFTQSASIDRSSVESARYDEACIYAEQFNLANPDSFEELEFPSSGRTCNNGLQFALVSEHVYRSRNLQHFRSCFTYFEGGNLLPNEDYVLVSSDVLNENKQLLEKDISALGIGKGADGNWTLSRDSSPVELSSFNIRELLARDMGLSGPERVYRMLPLDYHIDMTATLVPGKKVVYINNSKLALEAKKKLLQKPTSGKRKDLSSNLKPYEKEAIKMDPYEKVTYDQLRRQGFEVRLIGGRLKSEVSQPDYWADEVNFFNHVSLRLKELGEEGDNFDKHVVIGLSCPRALQKQFKSMFSTLEAEGKEVEYIFLSKEDTLSLLDNGGGISCMTKIFEKESFFS